MLCLCLGVLISNCKKTPIILPSPVATDLTLSIKKIGTLRDVINECSGFFYQQAQLFIINDSGGEAALYQTSLDNLALVEKIPLKNMRNVDWEAITTTETEIIIGDIGNNAGKRKDLNLLHFDKVSYKFTNKVDVVYPNQSDFTNKETHNFDCEALIIKDNQYHLFTKNRGNTKTNLYTAALNTDNFILVDSIETPALVTDAYYIAAKQILLLLGNQFDNNRFQSFISVVQLKENSTLALITNLPLEINEQLEAITLKEGNVFLLGSEREQTNGGNIYEVTINGL